MMQPWLLTLIVLVLPSLVFAAVGNPPAAERANLPSDIPRQRVETISTARHDYTIDFAGKIDGTMTRMPVSYKPYSQGWQPNLSTRIENIGERDVVNPWIIVNDRGDWRTLKGIVEAATRGLETDADKARALWYWQCTHRFHATTWDKEVMDVVKALNVYGYTLCGDESQCLRDLWLTAGFKARPGKPVGHSVYEVFYDNAWHLLDSDEYVLPLKRDNLTVGSETEVVRDHDLIKRTHTYGMSLREDPMEDQGSASLYGFEGDRDATAAITSRHTMGFTLRPGEAIEWRWSHVGKEYSGGIPLKAGEKWKSDGTGSLTAWGAGALANLRNGKWTYQPPLNKPAIARASTSSADNIAFASEDKQRGAIHPADPAKPGIITWKLAAPYVMVGGGVVVIFPADAPPVRIRWSADNITWQDVSATEEKPQPGRSVVLLDTLLSPPKKPMYAYYIQAEIPAGSALESITFDTDLQMSLLAMPELTAGLNRIAYSDESSGERSVRITHHWLERSQWKPPAAPSEALAPTDGQTVAGSIVAFRWTPPVVADGAADIADYHFQLCQRPDMRWPLSPTFDKIISRTPSHSKAEWTIPNPGLLNPDTDYYWRVRAKDANGVWGAWSRGFRFRIAAPGVPIHLNITKDGDTLKSITWEDSPGSKAVAWRVYGSNEQGFTASDTEYLVKMGHGFCRTMEEFKAKPKTDPFFGDIKTPANFIAEVNLRRFDLPAGGPLFAFYRVVAVDEKGTVGAASDYLALPRPYIYSTPPAVAKAGEVYTYTPAAILSIGHLTCRNGYNAAFWQREEITWTLASAPAWLTLKENALTGTPPADTVGTDGPEVILNATSSNGRTHEQRFRISVGK